MSGTKPYNQLREQLDGITTHPACPALDKEKAWEKLERLRAEQAPAPISTGRRSAIRYPLLGAVACLLLYFSYRSFQPATENRPTYSPATSSFPNNEAASASAIEAISEEAPQQTNKGAKPFPVAHDTHRKKSNIVPAQVLPPVPDTLGTPAIASAPLLKMQEPAKQPITSATPKKVYHVNELSDPDRPYSINKQKKKTTHPVAKQEKGFTITIPISN